MLLLHLSLKFPFPYSSWILFDIFGDLLRRDLMRRQFLCFLTGQLSLLTDKSSYFRIFNLATIQKKKLLKISYISFLLSSISSFSVSVIFSLIGPLSGNKVVTVFQSNLLLVAFLLSRLFLIILR